MTISQQELIKQMRENESSLLAYAADFVGHHGACDVVQEAFIELYRCRQLIKNKRAWLFKVCRNKSIDLIRKENRMHTLEQEQEQRVDVSDGPAAVLGKAESAESLQRAIATLPLKQQEVLRLKFHENMSYKAIADITGLTVTNVGFILHTVLKSLRENPHVQGVSA